MKKLAIFFCLSLFAETWNIGLTFWFEGLTEPEAASFFDLSVEDGQIIPSKRFKTISGYGSWVEGKWQPSGCEKVTVFWEEDEPFYECITQRGRGEDFHRGNSFPDITKLVDKTLYTYDLEGFTGDSIVPDTMWCTIDYVGETECFAFLSRDKGMKRMMEYFKLFMTRNKAIVTTLPPGGAIDITDDPFTDEFPLQMDSLWEAAQKDTFIVWRRSRPERHIVDIDNDGIAEVLYWADNQSSVSVYKMHENGPEKILDSRRNLFIQPIALFDATGNGKCELFAYILENEGTNHKLVAFALNEGQYTISQKITLFKTP